MTDEQSNDLDNLTFKGHPIVWDPPQAIGPGDDTVKPEDPIPPAVSGEDEPLEVLAVDAPRPARAPRCDCPALAGPHTHEPDGPAPLIV